MRTFRCLACERAVNFDDATCPHCGAVLGLIPDQLRLVALDACDDGTWRVTPPAPWDYRPGVLERLFGARSRVIEPEDTGERYRRCANDTQYGICNWLVDAASDEPWCPACRTNRIIPNLIRPGNLELWGRLERAKRRALHESLRLGLCVQDRSADPERGLAFDFLSSQEAGPAQPVLTGYCNGLITVAIDGLTVDRYWDQAAGTRDLVGLFRHQLGYYYWDRLIRDGGRLDAFRALFGDEGRDSAAAEQDFNRNGPPVDWQDRYASPAAASHPLADWAATWGLYLRIIDVLETAARLGAALDPDAAERTGAWADPGRPLACGVEVRSLLGPWQAAVVTLNDLNRNLGQSDIHPGRLSPLVAEKLGFVHRTIRGDRPEANGQQSQAEPADHATP